MRYNRPGTPGAFDMDALLRFDPETLRLFGRMFRNTTRGMEPPMRFGDYPTLDELKQSDPVMRLCMQRIAEAGEVSLHELWRTETPPSTVTPEMFVKEWPHLRASEIRTASDGTIWATAATAETYLTQMAERFVVAVACAYMDRVRTDAVGHLIENHANPVLAMVAGAIGAESGETVDEARQRMVAQATERTEDRDEYQQETIVARARRAFDTFVDG